MSTLRYATLLLCLGMCFQARAEILTRTPYQPASKPSGKTLFTELTPQATGLLVDNAYDDPEMWGKRYRAFMGGGMGSGIAVGDFDNDGRADLYVSTKIRPGRLFRNLGNWKFEDVTEKTGLLESSGLLAWLKEDVPVWRQGAVFADVNNDGYIDLYICRNNAPNLLYINQGGTHFKEEAKARGLDLVDGSVVGAFADYDCDGWLDVLVLTNQVDGTEPAGRADRLFRNTGNGQFVETTASAGISGTTFGHAAVWWDYNADRFPDLYIANDFAGPDHFYRNNGDGTFTSVVDATLPHTPYSSMGADAADVNNDGLLDLFVADMATTTREQDRRGLAISRSDSLGTLTTDTTAPQYMRNSLYLNTGHGIFREAAPWAGIDATDWTWSVRFEDFDNDGWTDLHVTNGMVREANNADLLAGMMQALSDRQRIAVIKNAPPLNEANLSFRNLGHGRFSPTTADWGLGKVGVSFGAATADLDGDGDLDLVHLDYEAGLSIFRNDVQGRNSLQIRLQGERSNRFGVDALVRVKSPTGTQTQALTVARGYTSGSDLIAHFGLGDATSADHVTIEWPSGIRQELTGLAAGAHYTIRETATAGAAGPTPKSWFTPRGAELGAALTHTSRPVLPNQEQMYIPFRTDRRGPFIGMGDLDGDGVNEVVMGSTTGSPRRALRWDGHRFEEMALTGIPHSPVEDGPLLLAYVDGNGTLDILTTKASAKSSAWPTGYEVDLHLNDGKGRFTVSTTFPRVPVNAGAIAAADIDDDGDVDIFIGSRSIPGRYPESGDSVLLRNDGTSFSDVSSAWGIGKIGLVTGAQFTDVDHDGRPDLVVAAEWNTVRFFKNDPAGAFVDLTTKRGFDRTGRGWWTSITTGDFNGDGRPDFALGNAGWNTTYHASPKAPATLLHGDFAGNGTRLLVEATYDGGTLYPLRSRADLATRLPFVARKFPKNNDFARATLVQVFGEKAVKGAAVLEADNLASGILVSEPDGGYTYRPFPDEAQIGPIRSMVAADFNGDGHLDLAAMQNSDAALPRFDGGVGLILQGLGDGDFRVLHPQQSGVALYGNGAQVAVWQSPGSTSAHLFVTRHGGTSELLFNQADQENAE